MRTQITLHCCDEGWSTIGWPFGSSLLGPLHPFEARAPGGLLEALPYNIRRSLTADLQDDFVRPSRLGVVMSNVPIQQTTDHLLIRDLRTRGVALEESHAMFAKRNRHFDPVLTQNQSRDMISLSGKVAAVPSTKTASSDLGVKCSFYRVEYHNDTTAPELSLCLEREWMHPST